MELASERSWRNDAVAKVTGRTKFADDFKFQGMLHGVPVYTDFVHARIKNIRTAEAEKHPGVVRVITAKDVTGANRFGQIMKDYRMFADDKVRYHGDVVALVVAESRESAVEAAKLVKVDAEVLPAILNPEKAMADGATLVHEDHGTNIVNHHKVRRGDVEKGFAESDFIVEQEFTTQFVEHAYLEPEAAICVPRSDGVFEIYGSMQHPFSTRRFAAAILGVKLADVEVKVIPMGGGFGGKDDTAAIVSARAALAAKLTGRPVKIRYDREWSIRESYKRHPYIARYKMGITKDGAIKAVKVEIIADAGAYCSVTPWVTWRSTVQCCGPYRVESVWCDTYGVYTNNVFTGAMRGFGSPQVNFCVEQLVEMAAEKAGMSPVEFRKKNMLRQGDVTITGQRLDNHTVSMPQVLDIILKESGYEEKIKRASFGRGGMVQGSAAGVPAPEVANKDIQKSPLAPLCERGEEAGHPPLRKGGRGDFPSGTATEGGENELYGIGLAMSYRGVSLGAEGFDFNAAIINAQFDGSILLEAAVFENGQGSESAMILLLAEELGVKKERIRYRMSSTSSIPDGQTTVASRGTITGGGAVINAARILKKKIAEVLAPKLNCAPAEVRFKNDCIYGSDDNTFFTFDEAMRQFVRAREYPFAFGTFKPPDVTWDEETGQGKAYFTWVYGCQAVELTVNKKTGKVRLLKAYAAHDVGRAVNPHMLLGQFYGGVAMGIGYGLKEELKIRDGRIQNLNLNTYRIPRSTDVPEIEAFIVENFDPNSPCGAKSIGEPATELMAPAIANAIYTATGRRFFKLPLSDVGASVAP